MPRIFPSCDLSHGFIGEYRGSRSLSLSSLIMHCVKIVLLFFRTAKELAHVSKGALKYKISPHVEMMAEPKKIHPPDGTIPCFFTQTRQRRVKFKRRNTDMLSLTLSSVVLFIHATAGFLFRWLVVIVSYAGNFLYVVLLFSFFIFKRLFPI